MHMNNAELFALMDAALDIATTLISWGITDDYAFWLASRRVTGDL